MLDGGRIAALYRTKDASDSTGSRFSNRMGFGCQEKSEPSRSRFIVTHLLFFSVKEEDIWQIDDSCPFHRLAQIFGFGKPTRLGVIL